MPVPADTLAADAAELLTLLTTGDLVSEELSAGAEAVALALQDPDAYFEQYLDEEEDGWLRECGANMTEVAVTNAVSDWLCIGDKADELYEQISDNFGDPLPTPPAGMRYLHEYLRLADEELRQRGSQPGGYELLELADSYGDELQVVIVFRKDTPRILELGQQLQVKVAQLDLSGE